jgi:hypothetical protein
MEEGAPAEAGVEVELDDEEEEGGGPVRRLFASMKGHPPPLPCSRKIASRTRIRISDHLLLSLCLRTFFLFFSNSCQ